MQDFSRHDFTKGLNQDFDTRLVPTNQYTDAQDAEFVGNDSGTMFAAEAKKSMAIAYTIPTISAQKQEWQIKFVAGAVAPNDKDYEFTLRYLGNTYTATVTVTGSSPATTQTAIEGLFTTAGLSATTSYDLGTNAITISQTANQIADVFFSFTINGEQQTTYLTKDFLGFGGQLQPVQSCELDNKMFVLSKCMNNGATELGVVVKSDSISSVEQYTYTRLMRTKGIVLPLKTDKGTTKLGFWDANTNTPVLTATDTSATQGFYEVSVAGTQFGVDWEVGDYIIHYLGNYQKNWVKVPNNEVIDFKGERFKDDQYALYFVDNYNKPKVVYVPDTLTQDCVVKSVTNPDGTHNLSSVDEQTNLQLINNMGYVEFLQQLQSGGALKAGGKRYAVRFGVGESNTTEWSFLTPNVIPVYKESTEGSAYVIRGNVVGETTSKANVLRVYNARPDVFQWVELAVVNYASDLAQSAELVGRYYHTTDIIDITHFGTEQTTQLDTGSLLQVQDVVLTAKNQEIKLNRMNYAGINIATSQDLTSIASGITQSQSKYAMDGVGRSNNTREGVFGAYTAASTNTLVAISFNEVWDLSNYWQLNSQFYPAPYSYFSLNVSMNVTLAIAAVPNAAWRILIRDNTNAIVWTSEYEKLEGRTFFTASAFTPLLFAGATYYTVQLEVANQTGLITITERYCAGYISTNGQSSTKDIKYGEYLDPYNCANKVGYMLGETYAFAIRFHYKNGYVSDPYPIDGGTFTFNTDTETVLVGNPPVAVQAQYTSTGANDYAFATFLELNNIDISSIRDQINGFSIWRAQVTNPTIMGTGVFVPSHGFTGIDPTVTASSQNGNFSWGYYSAQIRGNDYGTIIPSTTNKVRQFGMMMCPDVMFGKTQFDYANGDKLINLGQFDRYQREDNMFVTPAIGDFSEYTGASALVTPEEYDISDSVITAYSDSKRKLRQAVSATEDWEVSALLDSTGAYTTGNATGIAIALDADEYANKVTTANDYGVYNVIYKRTVNGQYDFDNITYVPTGTYYNVTADSPDIVSGIQVFGGDTYTQKTIMRTVYFAFPVTISGINFYVSAGISFYSQNRINTQLRFIEQEELMYPYNVELDEYVCPPIYRTEFLADYQEDPIHYDASYSADNLVNVVDGYNSRVAVNGMYPARIMYSEQKQYNTFLDAYRVLLPLNIKDLDVKDGEIVGLYDTGDYIMAIQRDAIIVLPYQADVVVNSGAGDVYVGNGEVYARRGTKVSTLGTTLKSATLSGKNRNGNPTIYWYSIPYKIFMRYSGDGIRKLSDENQMRTWFLNNTAFIKNEYDIRLGFNIAKQDVLITADCLNNNAAWWNNSTSYNVGNFVKYGASGSYETFEQTPDIYRATGNNTNDAPFGSLNWEYIEPTDNRYYNKWTLIFNELRNSFSTFTSYYPLRYLNFQQDTMASRPIDNVGQVYILDKGTDYLKWWNNGSTHKAGEFMVEVVVNKNPEVSKRLVSTGLAVGENFDTNNLPTLIANNETQTSTQTEWLLRRGELITSVKNQVTGVGTLTSSPIIGQWNKIKITHTYYIKLVSIINRFYAKFRLPFR